MYPFISIIVPNYNHARFIRQRLESIYAQTFRDFELIILDDCSTDNSIEVINQIIDEHKSDGIPTRFLVNESNSGSPFKQWKKGLELAQGEYIWIAESDDFAEANFLETLYYEIDRVGLDLCFSDSKILKDNGDTCDLLSNYGCFKEDKIFKYEDVKDQLATYNIIPNASAVVFKRSLAVRCMEDIYKFRMGGDWLFWALYLYSGNTYGYISKPLNTYRQHASSTVQITQKKFLHINEAFSIFNEFKRHGLSYNHYYWIDRWLIETGYSLKSLLSNNFFKTISSLITLDCKAPAYLLSQIYKHKNGNCKKA